jgi:hypothetical protein
MAEPCPRCHAAAPPGASECPNCGASFPRPPKPVDQLLEALDDLSRTVDAAFAEEEVRVVDEALGELEAAQNGLADVAPRHADLRAFVKRLEISGTALTHGRIGALPPRNPYASPLVVLGVLLAATGLFLVPSSPQGGFSAIVTGLALTVVGSVFYGSRPAPQ